MTKDQIEVNMIVRAIISLFESILALWTGKAPIEESINKLRAYDDGIKLASYEQMYKTTNGITIDKKRARVNMVNLALDTISKIRPFAIRTNNSELLVSVDYSKSDLMECKQSDCVNHCVIILNCGQQYLTSMATYNLTSEELIALETSIDPFNDLIEKSKTTLSDRVSATDKIAALTSLSRKELNILDDLVKSQMPEDFQPRYFNLR